MDDLLAQLLDAVESEETAQPTRDALLENLYCEAGSDTSVTVKRPRCYKVLKRGSAADFARWCGSNGSADGHGFASFANGASVRTWRRKPPGVLTVPGTSRTRSH
jgi:hypothetical protein